MDGERMETTTANEGKKQNYVWIRMFSRSEEVEHAKLNWKFNSFIVFQYNYRNITVWVWVVVTEVGISRFHDKKKLYCLTPTFF